MSLPVTEHFLISEFGSHDGTPYPVDTVDQSDRAKRHWLATRLLPLCRALEVLRAELGGARMVITSGYRTEEYNARIGGAKRSQHVQGRAADVQVEGWTPGAVHEVALRLYQAGQLEIGALGIYPKWNHIDVRPTAGHLAQWTGAGIGSEVA